MRMNLILLANNISSKEAISKHHTITTTYDLIELTVNNFKAVNITGEIISNNVHQFLHKKEKMNYEN